MALTVVLMLLNSRADLIKLPPLTASESVTCYLGVDEKYYKRLSKYLSRCITLSYIMKALLPYYTVHFSSLKCPIT